MELMYVYLRASVILSLVSFLLLMMVRCFGKRIRSGAVYSAWIIIFLGLLFPFRPVITVADPIVGLPMLPGQELFADISEMPATPRTAEPLQDLTTVPASLSLAQLMAGIWITGIILVMFYHLFRHYSLLQFARRWCRPVDNHDILAMHQKYCSCMGVSNLIPLYWCPHIQTPMLVGFTNSMILLPDDFKVQKFSPLVIKHEIIHYTRKDLWIRLLVLLVSAIHWFNPAIYIISKQLTLYCEMSCDEIVIRDENSMERQDYGRAILFTGLRRSALTTHLSTTFQGGSQAMKKRINNLFKTPGGSAGIITLALVLAITLFSTTVFARSQMAVPTAEPMLQTAMLDTDDSGKEIYQSFGSVTMPHPNHYMEKFQLLPYNLVIAPTPSLEQSLDNPPIWQREENTYSWPDLTNVYYYDRAINEWVAPADLAYFHFEPMYRQGGFEYATNIAIPVKLKTVSEQAAYIRSYYQFSDFSEDDVQEMGSITNQRMQIQAVQNRLNKLYKQGYVVTGEDPVADGKYMQKISEGGSPTIPKLYPFSEQEKESYLDWAADFDTASQNNPLYAGHVTDDKKEWLIFTTNVEEYARSPELQTAIDKGWKFTIAQVKYSYQELQRAAELLEASGINVDEVVVNPLQNGLIVHTSEDQQSISSISGLHESHITIV